MLTNKLAGASGPSKTYIEDVFSTYLYTGNGSTQTINNGIDLAGKGGMVWIKHRKANADHSLYDTERGVSKVLYSNTTSSQVYAAGYNLTAFNSNGFTLGVDNSGAQNSYSSLYASWTFRKAPKFFDVVTWTGDGTNNRTINHSLGVSPGMVIAKKTSGTGNWFVYHRSQSGNVGYLELNWAFSALGVYSSFSSTSMTLGASPDLDLNQSGATYVAYLFAHDTTTDGLIQCGAVTVPGYSVAPVTLGWEAQYILVKKLNAADDWRIFDTMRGWTNSSYTQDKNISANTSEIEVDRVFEHPTATGFSMYNGDDPSSQKFIYMAIRRGPMRTPTDATNVFQPVVRTGSGTTTVVNTTITPDLIVHKAKDYSSGTYYWLDRLRDNYWLGSTSTASETSNTSYFPSQMWDNQSGYDITGTGLAANSTSYSYIDWVFKRAPGFFDVVCYEGNATAGRTVNHDLRVAPEMMIIKNRSGGNGPWIVYHSKLSTTPEDSYIQLHTTAAKVDTTTGLYWNRTKPTESFFTLWSSTVNAVAIYVAYLFASCPGVSKVGSYTGNGSSQTINCGFTNGARFVLIKRTDSTGDWYVWDTARGIVAATDPHLSLNTTAAEVTTDDTIDPDSTGFIVNQVTATNVNVNAATYIYLAIA